MIGRIICSKSGRDKGYFMVIVGEEKGTVFVCDGKERPLSRPKKKNIKHISLTNSYIEECHRKSDKSLRKALAIYKSSVIEEEK